MFWILSCQIGVKGGMSHLLQVEAVGDVVSREEGGDQVGDGTSLAAVRAELEGAESSLPEVNKTRGVLNYK